MTLWDETTVCRLTRELLPHPDVETAKKYRMITGQSLCELVDFVTGHCKLGHYLFRMKVDTVPVPLGKRLRRKNDTLRKESG